MESTRKTTPETTANGKQPLAKDDRNANSPKVATKYKQAISHVDAAMAGIFNTANLGVLKW